METNKYYLAIDIGASSGRHIIGYKNNSNEIVTEEVYRFKNEVVKIKNDVIWDLDNLLAEVKIGIRKALEKHKNIVSMGIDTWGVDYVLMNGDKELYPCHSYRSKRTNLAIQEVHNIIPFEKLYEITGTQFQPFNTIYQLFTDKQAGKLDKATHLLMIPDYLVYKLTGQYFQEQTNASTTGLLNIETHEFSQKIISKLELPPNLFTRTTKPKVTVGHFTNAVQEEVGGNINVVLVATHDTASAVEALGLEYNVPYLSSGTWSLLGLKTKKKLTSKRALTANFTNELGPNYIRFQKNIMGLWIIQTLAKEFKMTFSEMNEVAKKSNFTAIFDVNKEEFLYPQNMNDEIIKFFKHKNESLPITKGDVINSTFYSLANSYKNTISDIETIIGVKSTKLYIVGGGAKNDYFNKIIETIVDKQVVVLPIEATALGNLKIQMEDIKNEENDRQV